MRANHPPCVRSTVRPSQSFRSQRVTVTHCSNRRRSVVSASLVSERARRESRGAPWARQSQRRARKEATATRCSWTSREIGASHDLFSERRRRDDGSLTKKTFLVRFALLADVVSTSLPRRGRAHQRCAAADWFRERATDQIATTEAADRVWDHPTGSASWNDCTKNTAPGRSQGFWRRHSCLERARSARHYGGGAAKVDEANGSGPAGKARRYNSAPRICRNRLGRDRPDRSRRNARAMWVCREATD